MRRYAVFWLPRPWPLWMTSIDEGRRPIHVGAGLAVLAAMFIAGAALMRTALRRTLPPETHHAG
jgi:hypothetical protein